eukprot:6295888-Alexandrium_andersonii.AAC.1
MREVHGTDGELETLSDELLQPLFRDIEELLLLRSRGPSVLMSRWASRVTASKWMQPQASARLLI